MKTAEKQRLFLAMVRAVLNGIPFMEKRTKKSPVVYLTEQNPTSFREAMKRADLLGRSDFTVLFWKDAIRVPWERVVQAPSQNADTERKRFCWSSIRSRNLRVSKGSPKTTQAMLLRL